MAQIGKSIGFIGSGNMGEAMIAAILKTGLFAPDRIWAADISESRLKDMEKRFGIGITPGNFQIFKSCDVVVLAVKPQQMAKVLGDMALDIRREVFPQKLILSIAAGITLNRLESLLYSDLDDPKQKKMAIIRVMPNTPALVLSAMSGMAANGNCSGEDIQTARNILSAMGTVIEVEEEQLDAVTAMSGSGPAYFFYFIEAMIQAGTRLGFDPLIASRLALETAGGALKMLVELGEAPEDLRRKVTSPGGTTEAAMNIFNSRQIQQGIIEGILAAAKRSKELSQP
ncbi:MAG: pyrroline-5-carboxylate reductase [Desulfobacteraceae bacterium]|nr:pyrroline-5-carboxylate reductase [Desulfobacteraceae bacterium]MBU4053244.1 pyrroline-5-carboxylate reductase [Pseudomonadota bacterium]